VLDRPFEVRYAGRAGLWWREWEGGVLGARIVELGPASHELWHQRGVLIPFTHSETFSQIFLSPALS